jgi:23S rRNA (cytosine1962-C5)-methyltransferase
VDGAATLVLKRGADRRLRAGHPWVYRGEIADLKGRWTGGEVVDVVDHTGRFVGRGFYNPRPSLACRLLTRVDEAVDAALFRRRLIAALDHRRAAGFAPANPPSSALGESRPEASPPDGNRAYRLCWSEADGLPGLVVDRYGPVTALQCLTLGMSRAAPWVAAALDELFPGDFVRRVDDETAARIEGFEPEHRWLGEPGPEEVVIGEEGCLFAVGPGHKTGFYLDQRDNRLLAARWAAGRRVLDAFCYTGAFACHALRAGAENALLIESSAAALAVARRNLALNGLADRAALREDNAFDALRQLEAAGERFGLVVLDPPPFTRRKDTVEAAARGYKEINLRGLRLLERGGVLATFSCSHHVTPAMFEEICRAAAGDAHADLRVIASMTQSRDHPILLGVPESRYLTGLLLQLL